MTRNLTRDLEAVLFVAGEPVTEAQMARALDADPADVSAALAELALDYEGRGGGLRLARSPEGVQVVTAPEAHRAVEAFTQAGMREKLTPAAAETLAIVAYRGPMTRAGIEAIRGVNSAFTLRLLALRGLVLRKPHPGDPRRFVYEASAAFLRHLGVARLEDLPEYEELHAHAGMTKLVDGAEASHAEGGGPSPEASLAPAVAGTTPP